ncbi:hypothetical protein EDD18DRAFT_1104421 [Armillaria luteobubalina]|uniref:Uncharacterized protein n=1 Tax=Armillaria luteobubalina TaxID=153913 RepID=A0AA39Q8X0_9AGAR|nr:hypothetical protein EDD18DRAFT_1104421 [Armillaria luteobubalina]
MKGHLTYILDLRPSNFPLLYPSFSTAPTFGTCCQSYRHSKEEDKYNDEEREGQILQHRKEGIVHYLTEFLEQIWFGFDAPCQGPLEDDRMLEFLAELHEFVEQGVPL